MWKQLELTCPVHACASPPSPSQLCKKSILSCQAAVLWKEVLREETSDQKQLRAATLSDAGGQGCHTGEGACSKTHLQYRRCLGVRAALKSSHQVLNRLAEALLAVQSPLLLRLIIPLTQWSFRRFSHLEHALLPPASRAVCGNFTAVKTNGSCPGRKKYIYLTQDFDATFIYLFGFF